MEYDRMKTKLYTSMIIALLVAGIALAMPVASVNAWGWRPRSVTRFTATGHPDFESPFIQTVIKETGDYKLVKTVFTWVNDASDDRADSFNTNTFYWLWKEEDVNGIMWGTQVIRETREGPVVGRGRLAGKIVNSIYTWKGVVYNFVDGYKVISWSSGELYTDVPMYGIIIET